MAQLEETEAHIGEHEVHAQIKDTVDLEDLTNVLHEAAALETTASASQGTNSNCRVTRLTSYKPRIRSDFVREGVRVLELLHAKLVPEVESLNASPRDVWDDSEARVMDAILGEEDSDQVGRFV